ncbi:NADPH-dependent FMN reductase [Ornithinimicrobium avium]|nr:NAD(P)H-dependent oxidoreductase [Ornithinimicrobium avium]
MSFPKIGVVVSTTRPSRIGPKVAEWVSQLAPYDAQVEIVDLAEVALPFLEDHAVPAAGDYDRPSTIAWSQRVRGYDALVLTVAEYNGGYPAVLKNALDTLKQEWAGMPVAVVGYGWGGAAAATAALGTVLDRLRMVRLDGPGLRFGEDLSTEGEILADAPEDAVRGLYDQLLAAVRESQPAA